MGARSRPAVLSVLLVVAVSVAVFASSSLALQDISASADDLLTDEVRPFGSLRTSGAVKVDNRRQPPTFRLDFKATFSMGAVEERFDFRAGQETMPDVVIEQAVRYPKLGDGDQVDFVGPVALPFGSQELVLRVRILGDCFTSDDKGRLWLRDGDRKCAEATLALDGEGFDVTELLLSIEAHLWPTGRDQATWTLRSKATFQDPGYPFPIVTLGDGSRTTLLIGPFGGSTGVHRVGFSGG